MLVYLDQTLAKKEGRTSILLDTDSMTDSFDKYIDIDQATGFPILKDTFRSLVKPKKKTQEVI